MVVGVGDGVEWGVALLLAMSNFRISLSNIEGVMGLRGDFCSLSYLLLVHS